MSPELVIQVRVDVVNIVRSLWAWMICSSSSAGETCVLMTLCSRSLHTTSRSKRPSLSVHPGILECSRRLVSCTSTGVAETNMVTRSLPRRRFALQYSTSIFYFYNVLHWPKGRARKEIRTINMAYKKDTVIKKNVPTHRAYQTSKTKKLTR